MRSKYLAPYVLAFFMLKVRPDLMPCGAGEKERNLFYDFYGEPIRMEDIEKVNEKLREAGEIKIEIVECDVNEAKKKFEGNRFKLDLLKGKKKVKLVRIEDFEDVLLWEVEPARIFVLALNSSSAYWLGNPRNPVVQRVNLLGFESKEELEEHRKRLKEAEKRDHRKIGKALDLFSFHQVSGSGLPLFHPKGTIIRLELIELVREINRKLGFKEVWTPHLFRAELYKRSGHYEAYLDKMFHFKLEEEYVIKPMNCPGHILIYKSKPRSYRDLPLRYSEFATVYRKELSGELHGLMRVWAITQDDHHVFAREEQVKDEVKRLLEACRQILSEVFGLKIRFTLSTRPEKYIGSVEIWEKATSALKEALEELGLEYEVKEGEGAFYGPKIDVDAQDALGRWWQLSTIQLDFFMPQRFQLEYVDEKDERRRPVLIHCAFLGSIERFLGVIIEHFSGLLPVWLSPLQVVVLPVSEAQRGYALELEKRLREEGIRAEAWLEGTLGKRIREAELQKVPYMLVVGEREEKEMLVSVRRKREKKSELLTFESFLELIKEKIRNRELSL